MMRWSPSAGCRRLGDVLLLAAALAAVPQARAQEKLPPGRKVVRIEAQPAAIRLQTPFAYCQLVLTAQLDNGDRIDGTRLAQVQTPAGLVRLTPEGLVRPLADGSGVLRCTLGGQAVTVPVRVMGQQASYAVSFVRDIMPVMSKIGCNAGTCHGAAKGKNGFKLSLRGYDPLLDHQALTDDLEGRRFNRAAPEQSLMLLKPSGGVPHTGGVLIHPGEPYYELLRAWIAQGVKLDLNSPRVTALAIAPQEVLIPLPGMKQQMTVQATYSDGSVRDVSAEAFIETSNQEVATVDKHGLVTALRRGEATMLARYEGAYAAAPLIVMGDRSGFVWHPVPEYNFIDTLVDAKLKQVKVLPSPVCTDVEFLRRIYLDLTGLPPRPEEVRAFLADRRPQRLKRDELVDKLVGSADFVEYWTNKWADLLQVNRKFLGEKGALALRNWIRQAVASNMPYDRFVATILTASGSTLENPPAAYYKVLRDPETAMENTTQLFLAVRFNCNKCHDHPFERWTQDQYYHLAAYFAQVGRKDDPRFKNQKVGGSEVEQATALVEFIYDKGAGEVKHERTGAVAAPLFPFTHPDLAPPSASRRQQLAHWVTSPANPYFAKSYVNRVWSYLLGVGLIEPIDDIRAGNPPSNPQLLERLTAEFIHSGFDVQRLMRTICKARVYQQSIVTNRWNQDDEINYSHALARRLPAEVLYDAIHRATGSVEQLAGMPPGLRAVQQLDSKVETPSGFLDVFGRPPRESACECERSSGLMLGPVLNLINGPVVAEAIKAPGNRISQLVLQEPDDAKVVEALFLAILSRPPAPAETAAGVKALRGDADEFARLVAEHDRYARAVAAYEKELPARQAAWEKDARHSVWTVLTPLTVRSAAGATLTKQPDSSVLASGKNRSQETYTVTTNTSLTGITGLRLEVLADPSLPKRGPGRSPKGNFVLTEFKVTAGPLGDPAMQKRVVLRRAAADFSQEDFGVANAIDGNPESGWAVEGQTGRSHVAVFEPKQPLAFAGGTTFTFTLEQHYPDGNQNLGRFRLAVTTARPPVPLEGLPAEILSLLAVAPDQRTAAQQAQLASYYRSIDAELLRRNQELAAHSRPANPRLLGAQDLAWALINSPAFLFNH